MKMAYLCSDKLKTIGMHSIHHEILRLALPSIISNITVPLLGLVDLTIVGHLGSEVYIGAIAVGTMIFNVLYWLLGFLRMGNSGMTSQALCVHSSWPRGWVYSSSCCNAPCAMLLCG